MRGSPAELEEVREIILGHDDGQADGAGRFDADGAGGAGFGDSAGYGFGNGAGSGAGW